MNAITTRLGESERKEVREDHDKTIQKAPPEQVDIYSRDFVEVVERFLRTEETLSTEERNTRLDFYTEYVERLDEMKISERLEEVKRLNRQYLSDYGVDIVQLKQMLRGVHLYSGTGNEFPDDLLYAIKTYQQANDLKPVDGIFGPATFQSLITQLRLGASVSAQED